MLAPRDDRHPHDLAAGPAAYRVLPDGSTRTLRAGELTVGRSRDNQLVLADSTVSRRHAYLRQVQHTWLVYDCGSSNGTWVNGAPVHGHRVLRDRDVIRVGEQALTFRGPSAPPPSGQAGPGC